MTYNYQPHIIGVKHLIGHLQAVEDSLRKLTLHETSVLIEPAPFSSADLEDFGNDPTTQFWLGLIDFLSENKAYIRYFHEATEIGKRTNQLYESWIAETDFSLYAQIDSISLKAHKFLALYASEFNPVFSQVVIAEKPEIIVAGGRGHALPLYKALESRNIHPKYTRIPSSSPSHI